MRTSPLLTAWMLVVCGLAVRAFARAVLGPDARDRPLLIACTIDVNRAGVGELQALPGIGPVRAEAIVLHRVRHGPFRRIDDLAEVDGLGLDTVAVLKPFCRIE